MSCLPFTVGLVGRAVKSLCFFLLHFPLGRQFSPNSATLPFAEGSSPTTSLQEGLWETTLQRVPCHVPQPPNVPCISPCPWGCHLLQPPGAEGNAGGPSVGCHPCCLPSARGHSPHAARVSSSPMCCFVSVSRLMLLCL